MSAPVLVNALDRPDAHIVYRQEGTVLPEFLVGGGEVTYAPVVPMDCRIEMLTAVDAQALWAKISECLTPRQFQMFELRFKLQYRIVDIAEITDVSIGAVSENLQAAIKKLRVAFGTDKPVPRRKRKAP